MIPRAPHLPEEFEDSQSTGGTNGLVSCSRLPSDKWRIPMLESHEDEEEEEDDERMDDANAVFSRQSVHKSL